MDSASILSIIGAVSVLIAFCLGLFFGLKLKRGRSISVGQDTSIVSISGDDTAPSPQLLSGIEFQEVFDPKTFRDKTTANARSYMSLLINGDSGVTAGQLLDWINTSHVRAAEFGPKIEALLATGRIGQSVDKHGRKLLEVVSDKGQYVGKAREVAVTSTKMARLSTIVVATAHYIAGQDVVNKLAHLDKKAQRIEKNRYNDLLSSLQSIFERAQELEVANSEASRDELRRLQFEVKKLRNTWLTDIHTTLDEQRLLDAGWLKRLFKLHMKSAAQVDETVSNQAEFFRCLEFAMALEEVISISTGEHDIFVEQTVPREIRKLNDLKTKLNEKSEWVRKQFSEDGNVLMDALIHGTTSLIRQLELRLGTADSQVVESPRSAYGGKE